MSVEPEAARTILALARRGRPYGDETEGDLLDTLAIVRCLALEAARRLVEAGRQERREDVWFLEHLLHEEWMELAGIPPALDESRAALEGVQRSR